MACSNWRALWKSPRQSSAVPSQAKRQASSAVMRSSATMILFGGGTPASDCQRIVRASPSSVQLRATAVLTTLPRRRTTCRALAHSTRRCTWNGPLGPCGGSPANVAERGQTTGQAPCRQRRLLTHLARWHQLPAIVMRPIRMEPTCFEPRTSMSLPMAAMPRSISRKLPAMVISSTG